MYIWVVLATFMVAIYSFNLPYRSDMKEILVTPQVEAVVGKMVSQHRAAEQYIMYSQPNKTGNSTASFFPGELKTDKELKPYLPYGFISHYTEDNGYDIVGVNDFRTQIFCLNKSDTSLSTEAPACGNNMVSCCSRSDAKVFLVTYGCVPRKWINMRTGKPKQEMLKIFNKFTVGGSHSGYSETLTSEEKNDARNIYGSSMAIRSRSDEFIPIPRYIAESKLRNSIKSFNEICGNENVDEEGDMKPGTCSKCFVYISPIVVEASK